jgi:DNA-binding SARP family transcriptional activator/TolB-like protein
MNEASIPARLSVSLFDSFSLRCGGRPVAIKNRKAQALLAYLILSPVRTETRERLCGLLWSESEEQKARASLRQTLHQIREILQQAGFEGFSITRDEVGLDKSDIEVDVWEVCAVGKELHPLLLDHRELPDSLLAGLDDVDEAFRSWLIVQRQLLHDKLERQLEDHLAEAGDHAPGVVKQVASALLNLDPTHEVACRRLIQAYADQGDVASALRAYRTLWDLLDKEYDVEPSAETQALIVKIRQGAPAESTKTRSSEDLAPRAPDPESRPLAELRFAPELREAPRKFVMSVSPFELAGLPADKGYIVLGFRHELIACLVRFREWYVRDAGQKSADTPPAVLEGLPSYYIDASAFEADGGIRLILTLRESGSEVLIWSERYLITLANWFETQQAVVRRIAVALNVHLSAERVGRVARERRLAAGL